MHINSKVAKSGNYGSLPPKGRSAVTESVQLVKRANMMSVPMRQESSQVNMSVSGASFNMANALNTGYPMYAGAGGFGIDVRSENMGMNPIESGKSLTNMGMMPLQTSKSHASRPNQKSFKKMLGRAIEREIANE